MRFLSICLIALIVILGNGCRSSGKQPPPLPRTPAERRAAVATVEAGMTMRQVENILGPADRRVNDRIAQQRVWSWGRPPVVTVTFDAYDRVDKTEVH